MAFVIGFVLVEVLVWEQVTALGSSTSLLVLEPMTMIPSFEVVAFVGLD
jgi:hypothetical protein